MTDELVGRESSKGLETLGEVVSHQERVEMFLQLLMGLVVVPFDGRILEGLVHALDLSIGPGMFRPGAAMFDGVLFAGISKRMNPEEEWRQLFGLSLGPGRFRCVVYEMRPIIGEHGVDRVGNGGDQSPEKVGGDPSRCPLVELGESEFTGSVDGDEEIELALLGPHLSDIDMEEADGILPELLPCGLVPLDLRQATDAVTLKTSVQRRAGQLRNRGLERVEAIVEWQ